jgi:hypothetical protein
LLKELSQQQRLIIYFLVSVNDILGKALADKKEKKKRLIPKNLVTKNKETLDSNHFFYYYYFKDAFQCL